MSHESVVKIEFVFNALVLLSLLTSGVKANSSSELFGIMLF